MELNHLHFVAGDWSWIWIAFWPALFISWAVLLYEVGHKKYPRFMRGVATVLIVTGFYTLAWAADRKLSALTELTSPVAADEMYIRDESESAAAESKKIGFDNLLASFLDGGSAPIDADKLEITASFGTITPDTSIAEADSADDLAAILEGFEDYIDGLNTLYLPLTGGTMTGELVADNLGIEFTKGDDHSDCSAFSTTGGGIFYDDSEGKFKKCQDNVLTDLDTGGGGVNTADIADVNVTQTEFAELETIGATTLSAAQWAGLGGATTAGIALWDDADTSAQRTTLGLAIGTDVLAEQTIGIADDNLLEVDGSPNDNEYARFTANGLEGRTEAEFKGDFNLEIGTDILAQQTVGIADDNLVEVDDADAADNDFAKFTANGLEGRSYAETLSDIGAESATSNDIDPDRLDGDTTDDDAVDPAIIGAFGAVSVDCTPNSDDTYGGMVLKGWNCGESISQWDMVYLDDTSNEWMKADADAAGEFPAVGVAVASCTDGNEGTILISGCVRNDGWNWSGNGKKLYLDDVTPGGLTETAPSTDGDCVQFKAYTIDDDHIYIFPSMHYALSDGT